MLFDCFVADIPSQKTSIISHVNRKTTDRYFGIFRQLIMVNALEERRSAN